MALNIIKYFLTKNPCYQSGITCQKFGIQIHTIGTGQGTAQSVADYWNQTSAGACVHYCVDADVSGKVLHLLPETVRSWADAGYGNSHLITIEICESDYIKYTGGANYTVSDAAKFKADILRGYQTAVELCADICKRYGWNPTAKLPNGLYLISSHDEGRRAGVSSAHVDPTHVWNRFGLTMDGFRAAVKKYMAGGEQLTETLYRVGTGWKSGSCVGQIGAYGSLGNAKNACKAGYTVFDSAGKKVYSIPAFTARKKYTLTVDNYIRTGVSGGYARYENLTSSVKKKVIQEGNKVKLKAGNTVEALEVVTKADGDIWIRIKNGWLCARHEGAYRLEAA